LFFHNFSTTLFDGSGTDAQRYFNTKEKGSAWKTAVLYTVLSSLFSLFIIGILIKMEIPKIVGAGLVIIGTGIGIGLIGRGAMDAIGRQPDASNKILVAAIVIAALVEGIAFAALFAVN